MLPDSYATWASCSASVLVPKCSVASATFSHVCRLLTHHFAGLLVPAACSLLSHSTDVTNPKHYHLQDASHSVSSLHLLPSTAGFHRCGQTCRQKLLASSSSIWLHPLNDFVPSTHLQIAQLVQCSPCPGQNGKAFSRSPSLGNCLRPMHNVVPSSPSTRDPVQLLSCISSRRLLEMPEGAPKLSNSLVLHAPSSLSSLLALQSQSDLWIDTV